MEEIKDDDCYYDGVCDMNALNTVKTVLACFEGKKIRVYVKEVT